ncbi:MAG TPA: hypothetical protein VEQ63_09245 [Bryobacteraceae bacterium]|nr:hypothetical protein [Bryobacteraceae bacterium]
MATIQRTLRRALPIVGAAGTLLFAHLSSNLLPLEHDAIRYSKTPASDPVARLNSSIAEHKVRLAYTEPHGYLESVLKALDIPRESQILVFTKTSFQSPRIGPKTPRALYFNDRVSVGWVKGGDVLEIAAMDPKQGVIFYTLEQEPVTEPKLLRQDSCLQCHAANATLGVPGLMLRSVHSDAAGFPLLQAPSAVVTHETPIEKRWGGWYVTGSHGDIRHKGNALARDRHAPEALETEETQNLTSLNGKFDIGAYLTPHSDIVALMVLEHQVQMINLLVRAGFETRLALHDQEAIEPSPPGAPLRESTARRINSIVEDLIEYMLFTKESRLEAKITGQAGFGNKFVAAGKHDAKGRSLRDLDLNERLFRHPCSYMIYSDAFDNLPAHARDRVYKRLFEILTGEDSSPKFKNLSQTDRQTILEILRDTKSDLPGYWKQPA